MSLANFQHGNPGGIGTEESKDEKKICIPRSSSPSRPTNEEDMIELRSEGMTTRSATQRKTIPDQHTASKDAVHLKQRFVLSTLFTIFHTHSCTVLILINVLTISVTMKRK